MQTTETVFIPQGAEGGCPKCGASKPTCCSCPPATGKVVSFAAAKEAKEPHTEGLARCLACKHEWQAVAPTGTLWLECPSCTLLRGRFAYPCYREAPLWTCGCDNNLFCVTPDGYYCPNCGEWQSGF